MRAPAVRIGAAATAIALIVGALAVTSCTKSGKEGACVHTALSVSPLELASQTAPVTLRATLTGDGKPLAAFRVAFSLALTGPTALVGKSGKVLNLLGHANTDAAGVATYRIPSGVGAVILPNETVVGYEAALLTGNPINGRYYCDAHARAGLT